MKFLRRLFKKPHATKNTSPIVTIKENSEDFTNRLKEFENQALINQIKTLEKVVTYLAQKVDVQSEALRRQSEAFKQMHVAVEEIVNVFETIQNNTTTTNEDDEEDNSSSTEHKKYIN